MAWEGSTRRKRLPKNWPVIRKRILARDNHTCTHIDNYGNRCGFPATDVDHIIENDDDSDSNLRSLCKAHHKIKSSSYGGRARAAQAAARRRVISQRYRRYERHPGAL